MIKSKYLQNIKTGNNKTYLKKHTKDIQAMIMTQTKQNQSNKRN